MCIRDSPAGQPFPVTAVGDLTLHGVTRPVEIPLQAQWDGTVIDIAGGVTVTLADYGIEPPSNSITSVAGAGEIELQVSFTRTARPAT